MTFVLLVLAQLYMGGVADENVYGNCWYSGVKGENPGWAGMLKAGGDGTDGGAVRWPPLTIASETMLYPRLNIGGVV